MRLLVLRHGQSEADILGVHEGRADYPLTALGLEQAERAARWIAGRYPVNAVWSSPLQRALATARLVAAATGAPLVVERDLREHDNGLLAGLTREEAARLYPRVEGLPPHQAAYGQEPPLAFRARAEELFARLLAESGPDDTVVVVSHGGTIDQLTRCLLRLPFDGDVSFTTGDTGLHEWVCQPGSRRVVRANSQEHLSGLDSGLPGGE